MTGCSDGKTNKSLCEGSIFHTNGKANDMVFRHSTDTESERHKFEKQAILDRLRDRGFRITRQRKLILDVILDGSCTSIKEIYATAKEKDSSVGFATVYRMVNLLEEIGILNRKNLYRISDKPLHQSNENNLFCTISLSDQSNIELTSREWSSVMRAGLQHCGLLKNQTVTGISISSTVVENLKKDS